MKSSKYTAKKQEKETLVFLTSKKRNKTLFLKKIIDDFNESQDEIYVEHMAVPNPDQELTNTGGSGRISGYC